MEYKIGEDYDLYGMVYETNASTYPTYSVIVKVSDGSDCVVRIPQDKTVEKGEIYHFIGRGVDFKGKTHIEISSFETIEDAKIEVNEKMVIRKALGSVVSWDPGIASNYVEEGLSTLSNPVINAITLDIYNRFKETFLVYPAATRFHHAYKYGLLFHTYNMLRIAKGFIAIYPHINKDLVYAGIILHDMLKTKEIGKGYGGEYSLEGKLLGHITMGTGEIMITANRLGFEDTKEALLLEHIVLSHHDEADFGSPKDPQIIEALIVHLCDMCDARITPTIEALDKVKIGEFSEPIFVNGKERYYKHQLSE